MSSPEPTITISMPGPPGAILVPVAGPAGPQGPQGIPGDPGGALGYVHTQASLVPAGQPMQIIHNLTFRPSGVICKETDGTILEPGQITWPAVGIIEITHGVSFSGTVFLS